MSANEVKAGKAVVEVSLRDRIGKGLASIERRLANFGAGISGVGAKVASVGAGMAVSFAALTAAVMAPLNLAGDLESVHASFKTMLGSGDAATAMLGRLRKLAAETPLEFSDIADAGKKLIAFGVKASDVESELRRVGDIASGIGAPIGEIAEIYGKAKVQGRLFAEDINQLTGRGIPVIQELAKQFGVTDSEVKKLVENGQVNFGHLQQAFKSLTSQGGMFFNAMKDQAQTLKGTWATFKDDVIAAIMPIGTALAEVGKPMLAAASGILKPIAQVIAANAWLAKVVAAVGVAGTVAGVGLLAVGAAVVVVGSAVSAFSAIFGAVSAVLGVIGAPVLLPIVAALIGLAFALTTAAAGIAYIAYESGLASDALGFLSRVFGGLAATASKTFGGIMGALAGGDFAAAAQILWAGVKVAFYQGAQAALGAVSYLWNNAYSLTGRFLVSFTKLLHRVFMAIPRLLYAALTGAGSFTQILAGAIAGNMDLGKLVDKPLAGAQAELDALTKKYQQAQQARQAAAAPPQQAPPPPQLRPGSPPPGRPMPPQFPPSRIEQDRMRAEFERQELAAAYARAGRAMPTPDQMRAPGELQSPAEKAAAAQAEAARAALAKANAEKAAAAKKAGQFGLPSLAAGEQLAKTESRGTFSAAAALTFGTRTKEAEATARNTGKTVTLLQRIADKPGQAFT